LGLAIFRKLKENKRNINLGIDVDNPGARWKKYGYDSPGTVKNGKRRVAGIMHVIVYVGL
jgi:hypothetical protein